MDNRQTIRLAIRKKREQLSSDFLFQASLEISHHVAKTLWFRRSHRIAFYQATQGELDLTALMQCAWNMRKTCYLPICHPLNHQSLLFTPYFPNETLHPNRYGILEPRIGTYAFCKPLALDLVFMPLIAFDKQGNRLGWGKGYYDRTFAYLRRFPAQSRPLLVGLAFGFQEVAQITAQAWDIPLHKIIIITHERNFV